MSHHIFRKTFMLVAFFAIGNVAFPQQKQLPQTFLWRISGNGLTKPSFLYGTIHLSDKKLFYFGDSLYHYIEQAEGFDIELDPDSMINATIRKWSENNNGKLLKSLMKKPDYTRYADKLSKTLGKPADKITTKDVWLAKNQKGGTDYKKGNMQTFMDLYLYNIAKKQGKTVGGIEDVEDQMSVIDDLFDEADIAYLTSDTAEHNAFDMVEMMKQIYVKQDLGAVESFMLGSASDKFRDLVLIKRNMKMARRMDSLARQRSSFFAVGVAHLPGDTGVINLLRSRGFNVEPVFSSRKISPGNYSFKEVELTWPNYTQDLNLYQVQAPGPLQTMDIQKDVMDMKYYYDLTNGKVYYAAVASSMADKSKKDSLLAVMVNRMAANNKTILSQKNITRQEYEGRDVVFKSTDDQVLHLNIFIANGYSYIVMVLSKKSELNDRDSKRFLESFVMTPSAPLSKPYVHYNDTTLAFSVSVPQTPTVHDQRDPGDGNGSMKVLSVTDFSTGNSYAITVRSTRAGRYIPSDSVYLSQVKTNLAAAMKNDTVVEMINYNGYPAVKISGTTRAQDMFFKSLTVLRGNRSYFLVSASKNDPASLALADKFLTSFKLENYGTGDWQQQDARDGSFSGWLPPAVIKDEEVVVVDTSVNVPDSIPSLVSNETPKKDEYLYYDESTGTSYTVQREKFSGYFFSESDSVFFSKAAAAFDDDGDSAISFKQFTMGKDKAADILVENSGSSSVKKFRFILHGDTLYSVFTYTPKWLVNSENTNRFFDNFSIKSIAPASTLFVNRTDKLIGDLVSGDSASFDAASAYLPGMTIYKQDLPKFYPLLVKQLKDFSSSDYNTNSKLINAVLKTADSSTVNYVAEHYPLLKGEQQKLQYPLLGLLARMKQPYANKIVVKLFDANAAPSGDADGLTMAFWQNHEIARTLSPKILSFSKDPQVALNYASTILRLLDSNHLSKSVVLPYLDNFITAASNEMQPVHDDNEHSEYELDELLNLLGTMNEPKSNQTLLEFAKAGSLEASYTSLTWLIKNGQAPPTEAINRLAASDKYRSQLYDMLEKKNKVSLFPAAQLKQKLFAASYLHSYSADDEDEPANIEFLTEKTAVFEGTKQRFFLFKVAYGTGDDAGYSLGIAGPFAITTSSIKTSNNATGIYWEDSFSKKEINNQFAEYLKQKETMGADQ